MSNHSHHSHIDISSNKMWIITLITLIFCIIEGILGYISNSLALMADAAHNLTDVFALGLSAFAMTISKRPADNKLTFGYHRVGILAALINALTLVAMAIFIFEAAIKRLQNPEHVQSQTMIWVAILAVIVNVAVSIPMISSAKKDLNIRSAYIHMLGDAAASLGVVIAGLIILFTDFYIADPIVSIIFALLVLWSSWGILKEGVHTLLESTPIGLDIEKIKGRICQIDGVINVHDLHVWTISSGMISCCFHIKLVDQMVSNTKKLIEDINHLLDHEFNINHSTIQIESEDCLTHEHVLTHNSYCQGGHWH